MRNTRGTNRGKQKSQFYYSFERSMRTILRKTQCGTLAAHQKSQFYDSFGRSMSTILRKGCLRTPEIAILLQFRAIDAHDPTEGLPRDNRNRNFTTVSGDRCARSYGRVAAGQQKSQYYFSFGRSMRTILRKLQGSARFCRTRAGPLKR